MGLQIAHQPSSLAGALRTCEWNDTVAVHDNHSITIIPRASPLRKTIQNIIAIVTELFERLAALFGRHIELSDRRIQQNNLQTTLSALGDMFGSGRLQRAMTLANVSAHTMHQRGKLFTKRQMANVFHALAIITTDDVNELLDELHSDHQTVRGITGDALKALRSQFAHTTTLESCSPGDIQQLEEILLLQARDEDLFWDHPEQRINCPTMLKSFALSLERTAWSCHLLRKRQLELKDWEIVFAKRLSQPLLPIRTLIPHPTGGYLYFSHKLEDGGVSKRFFKSLHPEKTHPHILYRGTRVPESGNSFGDIARSIRDDLRIEIGACGAVTTFERTKTLIEDPSQGFVTTPGQQLCLIGHSLGGTQSMRDTVLFHQRVSRLTTNSAPGIDKATADLFREVMAHHGPRVTITHNIDRGDIVDMSGDEHLGARCPNVSLSFRAWSLIDPKAPPSSHPQRPWTVAKRIHTFLHSGVGTALSNFQSAARAHRMIPIAGQYHEEVISTDDPETKDIAEAYAEHQPRLFDQRWEQTRRRFTCLFKSDNFAKFARQKLGLEASSPVPLDS